jgi:hypothetical protein
MTATTSTPPWNHPGSNAKFLNDASGTSLDCSWWHQHLPASVQHPASSPAEPHRPAPDPSTRCSVIVTTARPRLITGPTDVAAMRDPVEMLLVDAANVVGSRPTGWWKDRPGAARQLVDRVRAASAAGRLSPPVVVVIEGAARSGVGEGVADGVRVVHAPGSGDDTLVALAADGAGPVLLVSADRALRHRAQTSGADVVGPRWLLDLLDA